MVLVAEIFSEAVEILGKELAEGNSELADDLESTGDDLDPGLEPEPEQGDDVLSHSR